MSMQFELERMERLVEDLSKLLYPVSVPVSRYNMYPGKLEEGHSCSTSGWREISISEPWQDLDSHRWLRTEITIPPELEGRRVEFVITTGREGQWDATNPQMLFYVNGRIIQGVDVNHRHITLSGCAQAGERFSIAILAYSGTVAGDLIVRTSLSALDEAVEKFYYDFSVPVAAARLIAKSDRDNCRRILMGLGPAADLLDLRKAYSPAFYDSLTAAGQVLEERFYSRVNDLAPLVSAVGHTHIDIAWLWTVEQTREKALRSFSTVLRLMEQYPEYIFMSSQPILYQFVKEQAPELYEQIRQRVREGRWEVDGAMWLEADCNLPAGESLVRQMLKGRRFFQEEFGVESQSLWLPDVFGYSAALPQILKQCRIPYFMTTKIAWNQYNQLPNDTFLWKGIDGSQVFVFMPTTSDFDKTLGLNISFTDTRNTTTYTGVINPNMTLGTFHRFQNKDLTENTLMVYGFGDGGGGPTREMLENARRLRFGLPGIPRLELGREVDFYHRTYGEIAGKPEMPTWSGELYFEYHRGTYTSMGKIKRNNRKGEILCGQLETVGSMAALLGEAYPREALEECWDILLLHQFHDIIPGTAIEKVYDQSDRDFARFFTLGEAALSQTLSALAGHIPTDDNSLVVFNTQGFRRGDIVQVEDLPFAVSAVLDESGGAVPVQYTGENSLVFLAPDVPACGYRVFTLVPGPKPVTASAPWQGVFENEFYRAEFDQGLELVSLLEKTTGKQLLKPGRQGNALTVYEDRPINWDNWDVDVFYRKKPYAPDSISPVQVLEQGPVRTVLSVTRQFVDSTVSQQVVLYPGLPRIDFPTCADWREHNTLLKVNFPLDINATRATFEIQFGNVERETTNNHSWDTAKFETCAHKWADLSENGLGVSLLNDCKYGHSVKDGELELTLLKAGTYPNPNADMGEHRFTYSIYPHPGRWQEARTVEMAYNLNVPLLPLLPGENAGGDLPADCWSLLEPEHSNCFVETVKPAEDGVGYILRLYENHNQTTSTAIRLGLPFARAEECNLLEERQGELPLAGQRVACSMRPFEIKTLRLYP